jgi:hypothetical protein
MMAASLTLPAVPASAPPAKPPLAQKTSIQPLSDEQMRDLTNRLAHAPNELSEQDTFVLVDHYEEAGLCFPQNPEWISNVSLLVETFYEAPPHLKVTPSTRKRTAEFLFEAVYGRAKADADDARVLIGEVVLPLLERTLGKETESDIDDKALAILIDIAVSETLRLEAAAAKRRRPGGEAEETTVPVKHSGTDPPTPVLGLSLGAINEGSAERGLFSSEEAHSPAGFFPSVRMLLIKAATWSAASSNRQCVLAACPRCILTSSQAHPADIDLTSGPRAAGA